MSTADLDPEPTMPTARVASEVDAEISRLARVAGDKKVGIKPRKEAQAAVAALVRVRMALLGGVGEVPAATVEPSTTEHRIPDQWQTPEVVGALGAFPDRALAVQWGVSRTWVAHLRQLHGIKAPSHQGIQSVTAKKRREDLAKIRQDLGEVSDYVLAARVGRSAAWVSAVRHSLGIASMRQRSAAAKIDAVRELVGEVSDEEVARTAGVHPPAVYTYRLAHNIPSQANKKVRGRRLKEPADPAA